MKKEFINEAKRFQKLAGIITESQLNENGAAYFEKIWDMYMKHVMEDLRSGDITDEESESLQVMANNATYSTMDELINSINDIEAEIAEVFDDTQGAYFEELIMILNDICDKINYPNKVEFLKALIEFEAENENYQLDNPDLKKYDGSTKIINGISHTWLGSGYFPSDQAGIDMLKTSFVQRQEDEINNKIKQQFKGKKEINGNTKVKYFIENPYYEPDEYDENDEDAKYLVNTNSIVDAIKKYATQNNLELDPQELESYKEDLNSFGYDYGSGDFDRFEERGGYNMEVTVKELYKEFINSTL